MKAALSLLCFVVIVHAGAPQGYGNGGGGGGGGNGGFGGNAGGGEEPASYNFQYDINDPESGNNFGHQESRDGPRAEGTYYVQLPDSRLMTVEYFADETGYHPTITFEGEAQFPDDPSGQPSNQYEQPAPAPPSQQYGQPGFGK